MKRFYIKQISASGAKVQYSSVDFDKGLNIIHGPSNTGKSYEEICRDTDRDNFMSADEAQAYGLVDKVISHR